MKVSESLQTLQSLWVQPCVLLLPADGKGRYSSAVIHPVVLAVLAVLTFATTELSGLRHEQDPAVPQLL